MAGRWNATVLEAARMQGDPEADELVMGILTGSASAGISRGGYNHLLDLATILVATPELSLVKTSLLSQQLDRAGQMAGFFDPIEAPDWVDGAKVARAGDLWRTDSLLCIAVLYAASLPACYLMKKGVPALYATDKLSEQRYVFQRIFETGVMLEGVMSPGGVKVIHDVEPSSDATVAGILNALDPLGQWAWRSHRLQRHAGDPGRTIEAAEVHRALAEARLKSRRYIWGNGIVSARKVRFLHSTMRQMIQHPEITRGMPIPKPGDQPHTFMEHAASRQQGWDTAGLGVPINQEDLAYVLLTFGYQIPKGMEVWGRKVSREQKEDFLHLWKVVGYVMGIREDLMTDNLDEAEELYETILERNAGASDAGQVLTTAIMTFLRQYLPARFGLDKTVPAALIVDQLGIDRARMIVAPDDLRAARRPLARLTHAFAKLSIRLYYWLRAHVLRYLPLVGSGVTTMTEHSATALIDSWRDSFRREPFYMPAHATTWVLQRGVTPVYEQQLQAWRQRLFDTLAAGLGGIVIAGFGVALTVLFFFLDMKMTRDVVFIATIVTFTLATVSLRYWVPRIAKQRPKVPAGGTT